MKYFPALVLMALALVVAGCGGGVKLPPVEPEQVEVFLPGSYPTEEYKVLTSITQSVALQVSDRDLINQAKERAARVGADALIVNRIRTTSEGAVADDVGREIEKILEGLAVYFPSKHPELEQK